MYRTSIYGHSAYITSFYSSTAYGFPGNCFTCNIFCINRSRLYFQSVYIRRVDCIFCNFYNIWLIRYMVIGYTHAVSERNSSFIKRNKNITFLIYNMLNTIAIIGAAKRKRATSRPIKVNSNC